MYDLENLKFRKGEALKKEEWKEGKEGGKEKE